MSDLNLEMNAKTAIEERAAENIEPGEKPDWETPKIEDVSEQVMAQPYIRFT
jgi:hypothetical protein